MHPTDKIQSILANHGCKARNTPKKVLQEIAELLWNHEIHLADLVAVGGHTFRDRVMREEVHVARAWMKAEYNKTDKVDLDWRDVPG